MFTVRRWWNRFGSPFFMVGLVIAVAIFLRHTQGGPIAELYSQLTQPFHTSPPPQELWVDARVTELETRIVELEQQNQKLQELIKYSSNYRTELIPASVIGRSVDHWWEQLFLDQGHTRGVKEGFIVSAPGGLVGRVVEVEENTSRILLISDPTSKVGVKIARSGAIGYVRGAKEQPAVMEFFDKVPEVQPGDKIVTSEASFLFPAGIPVGTVDRVDLEKSPAPEVTVNFTAPFDYLEWVLIHPFEMPQLPNSQSEELNQNQR
ncbi:MAG: rod shape-determining protein MreC [Spirulina sp. SIO3F2]|nr:rod shape-determining protein MreC [Spirulina sp. SIO3F2]